MSEPCPECGILIQKNGGCSHVGCTKCKYEFCWDCLGSYKGYNHEPEYGDMYHVIIFTIRIIVNLLMFAVIYVQIY